MVETIPSELAGAIEDLKKELATISERVAKLEHPNVAPPVLPLAKPKPTPDITEEELLAISGALAAYLGVRVHIRQIRLISSSAWAQVGRVFIQASHHLHTQERP